MEKIRVDHTPEEFLGHFFNPDETVNIRVFEDQGTGVFSGAKIPVVTAKFADIEGQLREHNSHNRGIFFIPNGGGNTDKEINKINAQFVERDTGTFEEQWALINSFPLRPSFVVQTKKSLHTYWLIRNGSVDKFRPIQKRLVAHFGGDPACVNESRCLRLPGFNHCKGEPVEVKCVLYEPQNRYTQEQLESVLPEIDEGPVQKMEGQQSGLDVVMSECDFLKHCVQDAANLSEHDWYAGITNMALFEGGVDAIHKMSAPYPGYDHDKTQKKINHFLESGTKPITCAVIAEKGFKCPKFTSGECKCKSPAALCFKPLTLDGLHAFLEKCAVSESVMENMQTAKTFIEKYLYNVDPVTAVSFINYEMKAKLKLHKDDMKPLIAKQKEVYKKFSASSGAKSAAEGKDLPAWYIPTEKGLSFKPGILAEELKNTQKIFYAAEQYYIYDGGVYKAINDLAARNIVREKMIPSETKLSQITDAEGQWKMQIQIDTKELNPNTFIINTRNGLYNVLDGTLSEHTPDYLSTVQIMAKYDETAKCPRFIQYLHETLEEDQIPLVQEIIGYFLIPTNRAQKAFVIVGAGGSGKSKLLLVLSELLLGKENVSNVSWQALNERFKTAELWGKLANIFADLPTKNIDDNGIFKALVGEDYLTVERKNRDPFSFQSYARLLFSCNSVPKNYGDRSDGFYRRLILIRFNHAVPADKKDPAIMDKFRGETDGIFMFALEGLKRLIKNGFVFSETEANRQELERYREDSNSCMGFVKDCCEVAAEYEVGATMLYDRYKTYCTDNGLLAYGKQTFNRELESCFPEIVRGRDTTGKRRVWRGIRLGECLD
jgi:putative DNA primase/helicase